MRGEQRDVINMKPVEPFFRDTGAGPGIVCFHANASHSAQWRELQDDLAANFRVLALDSWGAGKSPPWPTDRVVTLSDEVALAEPVLATAGQPLILVGHSYGAAVALVAAAQNPTRVRAMALYEPTLFALLDAETPPPNAADAIREVVAKARLSLEAGDLDSAAERFIDYWMGAGAWEQIPSQRKPAISASVVNLPGWAHALLNEPTPLQVFSALELPVLYMVGKHSPASSRAVARLLIRALPNVECVEFEDLGHMGPITHPDPVNTAIMQFIERL